MNIDQSIDNDYGAIYDYLLCKIKENEFEIGEKLPSEMDLSAKFKVNRYTIRQALRKLVNLGLVTSKQGKGYFVISSPSKTTYVLSEQTQFTRNMSQLGKKHGSKLLHWQKEYPTPKEREHLKLLGQEIIYRLEIIRSIEESPVTLSTTVLLAKAVPNLENHLNNFHSLYHLLEAMYHFTPKRQYSIFQAILPSYQEALHLNISQELPLMAIESVAHHPKGFPVEYTFSRIRGDMNKCLVKIS